MNFPDIYMPTIHSFALTSSAMSSLIVSSFVIPSHSRMRTDIHGFQKHSFSTKRSATMAVTTDAPIVRRSANYAPSLWSYDHIQSLTSNYVDDKHKDDFDNIKEEVRKIISKESVVEKPLITLQLVDDLQRLGISYHFKDEICSMLKMIYDCYYEAHENWNKLDLNLKALGFRLLRQHGYPIPQEIFEDLWDERRNIKAHVLEDVEGMLSLYEASFLGVENENILDEAREFTIKCLKEKLEKNINENESLSMFISHALELPLQWRPQRFEAVWFIDAYKGKSDMKPLLLEFAKLDYNILQGIHQQDLKYTSRWCNDLGWAKKLEFTRDRLVECFMWGVAGNYEPDFCLVRRHLTKMVYFVTCIDDLYDTYGTVDELEQFTDVVTRWDINAAEGLPDYMKIFFIGLYNTINEMAYDSLINQKSFTLPNVKKVVTQYCEADMLEARWFYSGYTPTLEEYLNNAWITAGMPAIYLTTYFFSSSEITPEVLENVVYLTSMIVRLSNDLQTSSAEAKRGHVPTSIQCYMNKTGASEEKAKAYVKGLIDETWKKLNQERMDVHSQSSRIFIDYATDVARNAQFTYARGDQIGAPDDLYKSHQSAILFNPKS